MSTASLTVSGHYASLTDIARFMTEQATAAGFAGRDLYAIQMAVDEACSNVIQHAYGGETDGEITLACEYAAQTLTVIITDYGKPFDPRIVPVPDLKAPLQERPDGGLGVFLMRQLMDEVIFESDDALNRVTLIKRQETSND